MPFDNERKISQNLSPRLSGCSSQGIETFMLPRPDHLISLSSPPSRCSRKGLCPCGASCSRAKPDRVNTKVDQTTTYDDRSCGLPLIPTLSCCKNPFDTPYKTKSTCSGCSRSSCLQKAMAKLSETFDKIVSSRPTCDRICSKPGVPTCNKICGKSRVQTSDDITFNTSPKPTSEKLLCCKPSVPSWEKLLISKPPVSSCQMICKPPIPQSEKMYRQPPVLRTENHASRSLVTSNEKMFCISPVPSYEKMHFKPPVPTDEKMYYKPPVSTCDKMCCQSSVPSYEKLYGKPQVQTCSKTCGVSPVLSCSDLTCMSPNQPSDLRNISGMPPYEKYSVSRLPSYVDSSCSPGKLSCADLYSESQSCCESRSKKKKKIKCNKSSKPSCCKMKKCPSNSKKKQKPCPPECLMNLRPEDCCITSSFRQYSPGRERSIEFRRKNSNSSYQRCSTPIQAVRTSSPQRKGSTIACDASLTASATLQRKDKKNSRTSVRSNKSRVKECCASSRPLNRPGCSCHFPPAFSEYFQCTGDLTGSCCCNCCLKD